jgi:hypothetical protein
MEEVLFAALCELWPQPERRITLRLVAMTSIGAMRLAMESWRQDSGKRPLAEHLLENFAAWRPKSETGRAPLFHFVARRSVQRRRRVFMVAFLRLACATLRLIARQPACSLISMIRFKPFAADTIANFSHLDAHPRFSFSSAGIPAQRARPDDPTGAFASAVEHRL